jgi:hypothetical protein
MRGDLRLGGGRADGRRKRMATSVMDKLLQTGQLQSRAPKASPTRACNQHPLIAYVLMTN